MADTEALYAVFESFCQFGSTRDLSSTPSAKTNSTSRLNQAQMDGSKFAKFTRDCDLLDKTITPTEVDITFNKVKAKTERKITFAQFKEALKLIARKKYPSKSETEAYVHLVRLVAHNGNPQVATLVKTPAKGSASSITERLTNPSLFTGTQKVQFEIRNGTPSTASGGVKRSYNSVLTPSQERLDKISSKPKDQKSSPKLSSGKALSASASSLNNNSSSRGSVFDRLTDTSKYTGTHKERFDQHGNGLGLAGRDSVMKGSGSVSTYRGGPVTSLAQILRN